MREKGNIKRIHIMGDPEIKWRHFIEPVPKFLQKQPSQEDDSNVAFFRYEEGKKNNFQQSAQKKYKFIMSKTSVALLIGLLLLLCLLCFMAGFLISKEIHHASRIAPAPQDARLSQPFEYVPPKEPSKLRKEVQMVEKEGRHILQSKVVPLIESEIESKENEIPPIQEAPLAQAKDSKNPLLSKAQDYYHRLIGVGGATSSTDKATSSTPSAAASSSGVTTSQRPIHQAQPTKLWPHTSGSDEMFQVKPIKESSPSEIAQEPSKIYNYDVNSYLSSYTETQAEENNASLWNTESQIEENARSPYETQFFPAQNASSRLSSQADDTNHAGKYMVQVGAFQKMENAQQLASNLGRDNINAKVYQGWDEAQRPWYFVRIGQHATTDTANQEALKVTEHGKLYGSDNPVPYAIVVKGTSSEKLVK